MQSVLSIYCNVLIIYCFICNVQGLHDITSSRQLKELRQLGAYDTVRHPQLRILITLNYLSCV